MRREGLVSTACVCARFSVYFAVKLSVNVQAHNIRTYSADFAECSCMRMQSIPGDEASFAHSFLICIFTEYTN